MLLIKASLLSSMDAIKGLAKCASDISLPDVIRLSLWGNQADLSLHALDSSQATSELTLARLEGLDGMVIVNDIELLLNIINSVSNGRIAIVLDNAGF